MLALIPARGGSKGLPGKNLRPLGGHPLIAWSIAAAHGSIAVERVICTTDSVDIASVARAYGAETPFLRPAELADDVATDRDVFQHALWWLETEEHYTPDVVVQLRPTTPFREPAWIDEAVARMRDDASISCLRSIALADKTPYKMWTVGDGDILAPLLQLPGVFEPFNMPRQTLPDVYWHTGQLDLIRSHTIQEGSMTGSKIVGLTVPQRTAIDIDRLDDFLFAELVFEALMPPVLRQTAVNSLTSGR